MKDLKIKLNGESERQEAQELFFALGYGWFGSSKNLISLSCSSEHYFFAYGNSRGLTHTVSYDVFKDKPHKEVTLLQLRDMVVLKRNDVNDATHIDQYGDNWRFINNEWCFMGEHWDNALNRNIGNYKLKPIEKPMNEYLEKQEDGGYKLVHHETDIKVPDGYNYLYSDGIYGAWTKEPTNVCDALLWQRSEEKTVSAEGESKHSHYKKDVSQYEIVDVYRVLELFNVTNPCLQHAIKKLLCAGERGVKDTEKDIQEAIDTLNRYKEMKIEDSK